MEIKQEAEMLAILQSMKDVPKEIKGINESIGTLNINVAVLTNRMETVEEIQTDCKESENELDKKVDKLMTNGATAKAERSNFSRIRDSIAKVICLLVYGLIIYIATKGGV